MKRMTVFNKLVLIYFIIASSCLLTLFVNGQETIACGGYIKHNITNAKLFKLDFNRLKVQLRLPDESLSYETEILPNGAYSIAIYDAGKYKLTIDSPDGWVFEPSNGHEINVIGQESCNPDYNFYFLGFAVKVKVQTKGADSGPSGLVVSIKLAGSEKDAPINSCTTDDNGSCMLHHIPPGQHKLIIHQDSTNSALQFVRSEIPVTVSNDIKEADPFIIKGFRVEGSVSSNNQPIKNVLFQLFSKNVPKTEIDFIAAECDPKFKPASVNDPNIGLPLCQTISQKDGKFHFSLLPAGEYTLIPFYRDDNIVFDVKPEKLSFTVSNSILNVGKAFEVAGFSLFGHIYLNAKEKTPVKGAKVFLNEQFITTSDEQGRYKLNNMHFGDYSIKIFAEQLEFVEQKISLSPTKPAIADIVPAKYAVCGKISLDKISDPVHSNGRSVVFLTKQLVEVVKVQTHNNLGEFCGLLLPGEYVVRPLVTKEEEDNLGLRLAPLQIAVTVVNKPIFGLKFSQFRATLNGKVHCLEACLPGVWEVTLKPESVGSSQLPVIQYIKINKATPMIGEFQFNDILPGHYKLYLHPAASNGDLPQLNTVSESSTTTSTPNWCWKQKEISLVVEDHNVDGIEFTHEGYQLTVATSHDIVLHYQHLPEIKKQEKTKKESAPQPPPSSSIKGKWSVQPGTVKLCVPAPGKYQLRAESCHRLEQNEFIFQSQQHNNNKNEAGNNFVGHFDLRAKEHQVNIHFELMPQKKPASVEDIAIVVTYENLPERNFNKSVKLVKNIADIPLWIPLGVNVKIVPSSDVALFIPDSVTVSAGAGLDCLPTVASIDVQRGVFIMGSIDPPMPDVDVTIYTGDIVLQQTSTNKIGKFHVGPLKPQSDEQESTHPYRVEVKKDGYEFTLHQDSTSSSMSSSQLPTGDYYFAYKSNKLAEVVVKVIDEGDNQQPIAGVLISIVGDDYRSSEYTNEEGKIAFLGLIPGTFYVRAMMKEYDFQPSGATAVKVEEGKRVEQILRGKRSAYSIFGQVNSLNGQAESNILIEARELGPSPGAVVTQLLQQHCPLNAPANKRRIEQTTTNEFGKFRLRGLMPGCQYSVYVKLDHAVNHFLDRTVPTNVIVSMKKEDYVNVSVIAFRRINMMEVSAFVHAEDQYLRSLYLLLYPSNNPDHILKRHNFGTDSIYFVMNGLALCQTTGTGSSSSPSTAAGAADGSNQKLVQEKQELKPRQYVLRLESTLSPALYDNISAQEIVFSASYDANNRIPGYQQKHFQFNFNPMKKPSTDQEVHLNIASVLALPLLLAVSALAYMMRDSLRVLLHSTFQRLQTMHVALPSNKRWTPTPRHENVELDPKVVQSLNSFVVKRPGSTQQPVKKQGFWSKSKK